MESARQTVWELTHVKPSAAASITTAIAAASDWRAASVPGNVQTSPFGLPPDTLYRRDHIDTVRWMDAECWLYRTTVEVPALRADEEAVYRFEGVDYACRYAVDGVELGRHEGMFSSIELPLASGRHEVVILIDPFEPTSGTVAPEHLKAPVTVGRGWDFAPKLQPRGVWNQAGLWIRPKLRIVHAHVMTRLANRQRADVAVVVELSEAATGVLAITLGDVSRETPLVDCDRLTVPLQVFSPQLWWPNGHGAPTLHDLTIEVRVAGRSTIPFRQRVGLRAIDRTPCDGQAGEDIPLQLTVNGRPLFLKGVNWVPLDACPGTATADRYSLFLRQFREAGVNLIRVWGGGLCEHDDFYRLADELGLMVLQEFPLACQRIASGERFLALLKQECVAIIRRLHPHPAVVLWSGGNEHYHLWDKCGSGTPTMERVLPWLKEALHVPHDAVGWLGGVVERYDHPAIALMASLCAELDPGRPFQSTSAMEGEGEAHGIWTWNPRIGDHRYRDSADLYDYWLHADQHLYSEASVSAIANLATIVAVLDDKQPSFPASTDPLWRLHHAFHAAWESLPDLWLDVPSTDALFGAVRDLPEFVLANQWMQGEGGRFMVEELRRRMGRTSGVIWWGVNEPWPGLAGNALIDWYGRPKLGWQLIANAFRPTMLSLRYRHCVCRMLKPELWLTHDGPEPFTGRWEVTVFDVADGRELERYEGAVALAGQGSLHVRTLDPRQLQPGDRRHLCCRLSDDRGVCHRNDYLFAGAGSPAPFDAAMRRRIRELWPTDQNSFAKSPAGTSCHQRA